MNPTTRLLAAASAVSALIHGGGLALAQPTTSSVLGTGEVESQITNNAQRVPLGQRLRLIREMDLSPDQRTSFTEIHTRAMDEFREIQKAARQIRPGTRRVREESLALKQRLTALSMKTYSELDALLTPEQKQELEIKMQNAPSPVSRVQVPGLQVTNVDKLTSKAELRAPRETTPTAPQNPFAP